MTPAPRPNQRMIAPRHRGWIFVNWIVLAMFALSVLVQLNDPDPWRWVAIYALAACACAMELAHRSRWWIPTLIALVALGWSATLAPGVLGRVPFGDMFSAWEMQNQGIEQSREMYGLLLIAAWMFVLALLSPRSAKGA